MSELNLKKPKGISGLRKKKRTILSRVNYI